MRATRSARVSRICGHPAAESSVEVYGHGSRVGQAADSLAVVDSNVTDQLDDIRV